MKYIKKGFTLIEMAIVVVVLSFIFTIVIQSYFKLTQTKTDIYIRGMLAKNTNALIEKINLLMKNYTIDYEEYFNRRIVGCDSDGGDSFSWDVGENGYCDKFTAYGNENGLNSIASLVNVPNSNHILYYCSSVGDDGNLKEELGGDTDCEGNSNTGNNYIFSEKDSNHTLGSGYGCWRSLGNNRKQSFGEYEIQFWDFKKNADGNWGCKGDDDDMDLGLGPIAIADNTNVKELYLISKDKKRRMFLRRKLIFSGDLNNDGRVESWEKLYKIQILKLRGFDLGSGHNGTGVFAYDGEIDTWACDKLAGFVCNGDEIGGGYVGYYLPKDENDGWQDLNITDLTIDNLNFTIYPTKNSTYDFDENKYQITPYVAIDLTTSFYGKNYMRKINPEVLSGYKMHINTTFTVKEY